MNNFEELSYLTTSEVEAIKKFGIITIKDICFNCGLSRQTVYRYIKSGKLHSFKIFPDSGCQIMNIRWYVIRDSAYDEFIKLHSMF